MPSLNRRRAALLAAAALAGCDRRLSHQPKLRPLEPSPLFADGRSARPLPAGVIPADGASREEATGEVGSRYAERFAFPIDRALLLRGRERYEIYCAVCHDRTGSGDGIVIRRGFKPRPPAFSEPRLMSAPPGLFVSVIANGYGHMYPYGDRVRVRDRWAIAAYIRALQLAARADARRLPAQDRARLKELP